MPKYLDSSGVAYLWGKLKNDLNDKMVYYSKTKEEWDSDIETISQMFYIFILIIKPFRKMANRFFYQV